MAETKSGLGRFFGLGRRGLQRFELESEIARGGMSVVYRAQHRDNDSVVAIKIMTPKFTAVAEKLEEIFHRGSEGSVAASLRHENVVRTLEYGAETSGGLGRALLGTLAPAGKARQYYIVMEFIDGPNLKQLIDTSSTRWRDHRFSILLQMGRGLNYIHRQGLVHRDFCPKNVLLNQAGEAKIIDFGLAIPADLKMKWHWDRSGTASYMAPEQVRGQPVDFRTDIYAFGVAAYEVMTGRRPFPEGRTRMAKMQGHLNVNPTSPRHYDREIPMALEHIIMKAMRKDPAKRYPAMDGLLKELQLVADTFYE